MMTNNIYIAGKINKKGWRLEIVHNLIWHDYLGIWNKKEKGLFLPFSDSFY